jgi:hypothetical protein
LTEITDQNSIGFSETLYIELKTHPPPHLPPVPRGQAIEPSRIAVQRKKIDKNANKKQTKAARNEKNDLK